MSTVKITELPAISVVNANTSNTILVGVDVQTDVTGKITLTTLARYLYSNNSLYVGNTLILLPNAVAQFSSNSDNYVQVNLQNERHNGSADIVITADTGTDENYYIDLGYNNSNYNYSGYRFAKPLDGYLVVQGNNTSPTAIGGNLIIGTTTVGKDIIFTQGAFDETGQVGKFVYNTGFKLIKNPLIFADDTTQNTAVSYSTINSRITSNTTTLRGEITANADSANSVINTRISANVATLRGEITANAASTNAFANLAFTKANNALANTSGTFAGNLTTTGNVIVKYALTVNNTSMPGNTQYIVVTGTASGNIGTPSNPGYTFHSAVDDGNRIVAESYSNTATNYASFIGRRARGTAQNPLPTQNGDTILRLGGNSFGSTKYSQFSDARIEFVATENHSDTAKGTKIRFLNTAEGTNTASEIASFNANTVTFTGTVNPQKGFIYTPRILSGAQTAITIDFASDSMVRATFSSTLTISFSNYTYGKVVECWLTNTAGNGQTINLGALANNTTTGSATLTVAAGRSAKLQYFSIDGDLANTFLAITYA